MKLDTRVFPDIDALSRAAVQEMLRVMQDAVKQRGRFVLALSGGHTPYRKRRDRLQKGLYHRRNLFRLRSQ